MLRGCLPSLRIDGIARPASYWEGTCQMNLSTELNEIRTDANELLKRLGKLTSCLEGFAPTGKLVATIDATETALLGLIIETERSRQGIGS